MQVLWKWSKICWQTPINHCHSLLPPNSCVSSSRSIGLLLLLHADMLEELLGEEGCVGVNYEEIKAKLQLEQTTTVQLLQLFRFHSIIQDIMDLVLPLLLHTGVSIIISILIIFYHKFRILMILVLPLLHTDGTIISSIQFSFHHFRIVRILVSNLLLHTDRTSITSFQ